MENIKQRNKLPPSSLTDEEVIAEAERLLKDITPGPWRAGAGGNNRVYGPDNAGDDSGLIASVFKGPENRDFIAAAPRLVRDLLARLSRQKEEKEPEAECEHEFDTHSTTYPHVEVCQRCRKAECSSCGSDLTDIFDTRGQDS